MATERSKLVKQLDKVFSQAIRLRATDEFGYGECFTCGSRKHWKEVDAGHFMSRAKMRTRWHEDNVQFQCKRCNGFRGGEQYKFAQELDALHGDGKAEELVRLSNETAKYGVNDLRMLISFWKLEFARIQSEKLEG